MDTILIDINCDVGEGIGNEAELLPLISSCNIACGGHAGDEITMQEVMQLAKQNDVKVGAHPSYPDKENFGRKTLNIANEELKKSIKNQLDVFIKILEEAQLPLHHIKPHGALYNDVARNLSLAKVFLEVIKAYKEHCFLYAPFGSIISKEAIEQGFQIKYEAFADRNYNADLSLVARSQSNAIIEAPELVLEHLLNIAKNGKVISSTEESIVIKADTFCVHGDTSSALEILTYLSEELPKNQIEIRK
ncbi:5-oxoprolinase subunit PxpA [Croceitalea rosinachiae]|uniref:5-oxoprolinase subunit PxpA n=1 Tax=Croceitalea rosinachiae TaxID=3075596 RepID=A0ABU3AC35_9FLAO|nr:5-oxoprolinase subunit PxpA [Croceitalea sp. F388]MDT0607737.1 5-oxoprolinase subunit PxpA [Croceitalea sp. F388]